jgi:hypothetical protein
MSYATILIPSSGILAAYADSPSELENALGIYLITCALPGIWNDYIGISTCLCHRRVHVHDSPDVRRDQA